MSPGCTPFRFFCCLLLSVAFGLTGAGSAAAEGGYNPAHETSLWLARTSGVLKVSAADGTMTQQLPLTFFAQRVAVNPVTADVWVYGSHALQRYSASGEKLSGTVLPWQIPDPLHLVMTADPISGHVWLAQFRSLFSFTDSGVLRFRLDMPGQVRGMTRNEDAGLLYFLHAAGIEVMDDAGEQVASFTLGDKGKAISWDAHNRLLWVAANRKVYAYSEDGQQQLAVNIAGITHLAADPSGAVWMASPTRLYRMHASGVIGFSLHPFQHYGMDRVVRLAVDLADNAVWVAGIQALVKVDELGNIAQQFRLQDIAGLGALKDVAHYADTTPPSLTITAPAADSYLAQRSPTVILTAEDQGIGVDPDTFVINIDHQQADHTCQASQVPHEWHCLLQAPLPEGLIRLQASVADYQNNRSDTAETFFTVDVTPPELVVISPAGDAWLATQTVQLVGHINEAGDVTLDGTPLALDMQNRFTHTLSLMEGENHFLLEAKDLAGNQSSMSVTVHLDTTPPEALSPSALTWGSSPDGTVSITGHAGAAEAGSSVEVTNLRTSEVQTVTVSADGSFTLDIAAQPGDTFSFRVVDRAGNGSTVVELAVPGGGDLPSDPASVAPPLDPAVPTTLHAATSFLYSGSNPIQRDVQPGAIEERRITVMRGLVKNRDGEPLPGVRIAVKDHPEFGHTLSRADGMFDLAANGGGYLTLNYEREGFLPVQRQINTPWQDYIWSPDVVMIPVDDRVTTVTLNGNAALQVARGNSVTDTDGTRTATVFFPSGTTAEIVLPDGSTQSLTTLSVRATEYTVGENGPETMPGELPPTSGYTYAVELSVDEAMAADAKEVRFNQPVPFYVENFLGFPVGGVVPTGWYDRDKAAWLPSDNGRVVKVLAITDGLAELDIAGAGVAADAGALAALGITDDERRQLAMLYTPGQSLWRALLPHFTPWDCNWPYGPPEDAEPPPEEPPEPDEKEEDPCEKGGSIIECQNQVLGQEIPITGTPLTLNYRSDRAPGRKAARTLEIPLSNDSIPASLQAIVLQIHVAGRQFHWSFPAKENQIHTFVWDGKDAFGRTVIGEQKAKIRIGYEYGAVYYAPEDFSQAFGMPGNAPISGDQARETIAIWREDFLPVRNQSASVYEMAGFSLNHQDFYYASTKTLLSGSGRVRNAETVGETIEEYFGKNQGIYSPTHVVWSPDGSLYVSDVGNHTVRRIDSTGAVTTVAGTGRDGFGGDGGPAAQAQLTYPRALALGPDGSLFIADYGNRRIRKIDASGVITTVAGTGMPGFTGDGGPATKANMSSPIGVTVGPDGTVYFTTGNRVRRVDPAGTINTIAGTGLPGFAGDGGPAVEARLSSPQELVIDRDGSLYLVDTNTHRIRRISPDGIIRTVAGGGTGAIFFDGDGGLATDAVLYRPTGVAIASDGSFYIADTSNHRVRKVDGNGIINTVAGSGVFGYAGDGGVAVNAAFRSPGSVAWGADGVLYIVDRENQRIRQVLSRFGSGDLTGFPLIPSEDGSQLREFSGRGRHLRTLNATTGRAIYEFGYDSSDALVRIEDASGNLTRIERDAAGKPVAIIAPEGQRTELTLDANGYLASVTNPAGERWEMTYTEDGLMTRFQYPHGHASTYAYDALGRLQTSRNAEGGGWNLARASLAEGKGYLSSMTSLEGRVTSYLVEHLPIGSTRRTNQLPDGTSSLSEQHGGVTTLTAVDGTVTRRTEGPDPRFGMASPVPQTTIVSTPAGLVSTTASSRSATLLDKSDLLSHTALSETITTNGRTRTASYDTASRTWTTANPTGRSGQLVLNEQGDPVLSAFANLAPSSLSYDSRGRIVEMTRGTGIDSRTSQFAYNSAGYLASLTDALDRTVSFDYDAAGRITRQTQPDGREVNYQYDANGNLIALTPPGRDAHVFAYDVVDQESAYTPPTLPEGATVTRYHYNLDKQLTAIERPDNKTVSLAYNSGGKLAALNIERGRYGYSYHATTGKLSGVTAPDGTALAYNWDGFLPLSESWSGDIAGSVSQSWDNNFWLTQRCVNTASCIDFSYDNDGLLTQAGAMTLQRSAANGLIDGTSLLNTISSHDYNAFGEPVSAATTHGGSAITTMNYARDKLGRITARTEAVDGTSLNDSYTYDLAGRLTGVTRNGVTTTWQYDSNGNRTHENGQLIATYDAQDRLLSYKGNAYSYTKNGELLSKTEGGATTSYSYDELGNLMSAQLPGDITIDYVIDGRNRRIGKKINGTLTQAFLYKDQLNPVAELDGNGTITARFIYADKGHVPSYMVKNGNTYRIVSDHLGSPRLVVNADTGEVAQRISYDVWGNITEDTNPGFQPFGFAGGIYDQHTQLTRFGARDYDAQTGRWTKKDPIRFDGGDANLYGYAMSNPVNLVDSTGLTTMRCARELGGPEKPALEPNGSPLRHDYLVVDGEAYSFGPDGNIILSGGNVSNNERTNGESCEEISSDPEFDEAVRQAVDDIGDPLYSVGAYPFTKAHTLGARNCQTWTDDVLNRAQEILSQ